MAGRRPLSTQAGSPGRVLGGRQTTRIGSDVTSVQRYPSDTVTGSGSGLDDPLDGCDAQAPRSQKEICPKFCKCADVKFQAQ